MTWKITKQEHFFPHFWLQETELGFSGVYVRQLKHMRLYSATLIYLDAHPAVFLRNPIVGIISASALKDHGKVFRLHRESANLHSLQTRSFDTMGFGLGTCFSWLLLLTCHSVQALVLNPLQATPQPRLILPAAPAQVVANTSLEVIAASTWSNNNYSVSVIDSSMIRYRCDGHQCGFNIAFQSCFNAITNTVFDWENPSPKTWGPRHTRGRYDFLLPQRFISSKSDPQISLKYPLIESKVTGHAISSPSSVPI